MAGIKKRSKKLRTDTTLPAKDETKLMPLGVATAPSKSSKEKTFSSSESNDRISCRLSEAPTHKPSLDAKTAKPRPAEIEKCVKSHPASLKSEIKISAISKEPNPKELYGNQGFKVVSEGPDFHTGQRGSITKSQLDTSGVPQRDVAREILDNYLGGYEMAPIISGFLSYVLAEAEYVKKSTEEFSADKQALDKTRQKVDRILGEMIALPTGFHSNDIRYPRRATDLFRKSLELELELNDVEPELQCSQSSFEKQLPRPEANSAFQNLSSASAAFSSQIPVMMALVEQLNKDSKEKRLSNDDIEQITRSADLLVDCIDRHQAGTQNHLKLVNGSHENEHRNEISNRVNSGIPSGVDIEAIISYVGEAIRKQVKNQSKQPVTVSGTASIKLEDKLQEIAAKISQFGRYHTKYTELYNRTKETQELAAFAIQIGKAKNLDFLDDFLSKINDDSVRLNDFFLQVRKENLSRYGINSPQVSLVESLISDVKSLITTNHNSLKGLKETLEDIISQTTNKKKVKRLDGFPVSYYVHLLQKINANVLATAIEMALSADKKKEALAGNPQLDWTVELLNRFNGFLLNLVKYSNLVSYEFLKRTFSCQGIELYFQQKYAKIYRRKKFTLIGILLGGSAVGFVSIPLGPAFIVASVAVFIAAILLCTVSRRIHMRFVERLFCVLGRRARREMRELCFAKWPFEINCEQMEGIGPGEKRKRTRDKILRFAKYRGMTFKQKMTAKTSSFKEYCERKMRAALGKGKGEEEARK